MGHLRRFRPHPITSALPPITTKPVTRHDGQKKGQKQTLQSAGAAEGMFVSQSNILPAMISFQEALRVGSLEALRLIPKSDLHNHAFGGGNRAWIARTTGRGIAPLDHPLGSMGEMHEWVGRHIGPLFDGPTGRLTAFEATLVQARDDGVTRLEVGEDVWAITLFDRDAAKLTRQLVDIHDRVAPDINGSRLSDCPGTVPCRA